MILGLASKSSGMFSNKYFWIAVALIIVLFIIWKNWDRIKYMFRRADINYRNDEPAIISEADKIVLEDVANKVHTDIYDTSWTGHKKVLYQTLNALSDSRLKYLARYYKSKLANGVSLYTDLGDEVYTFDEPDQIKTRLIKIGEKY